MTRAAAPIVITCCNLLGASPALAQVTDEVCVEPTNGSNVWDWDNREPGGAEEIRVYTFHTAHLNLERSPGVKWTQAELDKSVKAWIVSFQESMGVGFPPMRYAGISMTGNEGAGTVTISAYNGQDCDDFFTNGGWDGDAALGGRLIFKRSGSHWYYDANGNPVNNGYENCDHVWKQFDPTDTGPSGPGVVWRGLLNHEMMHGFGNKHDGCVTYVSCPAFPAYNCSCGSLGVADLDRSWNCYRHDYKRIRDWHVDWDHPPSPVADALLHKESAEGLNWSGVPGFFSRAPLGGFSSNSLPYLFYVGRSANTADTYAKLSRWVYTTQAWEYWGVASSSSSDTILGAIGVAYGGSPAYPFVSHTGSLSNSDPLKEINVTRFTAPNAKTRWTWGNDLTPTDGTSIAYDAGSGWFLVVWRNDHLQIMVTAMNSSGTFGTTTPLWDVDNWPTPLYAMEPPSIACGPASITGRRCVIVWAGAPDPEAGWDYQILRWVPLHAVTNGDLSLGSWRQQGFEMYGPPRVAYNGPESSSTAFVLAYKRPPATVGQAIVGWRTIGKAVSETSNWNLSTLRTHGAANPSNYTPMIGTAGGAYEMGMTSR